MNISIEGGFPKSVSLARHIRIWKYPHPHPSPGSQIQYAGADVCGPQLTLKSIDLIGFVINDMFHIIK